MQRAWVIKSHVQENGLQLALALLPARHEALGAVVQPSTCLPRHHWLQVGTNSQLSF